MKTKLPPIDDITENQNALACRFCNQRAIKSTNWDSFFCGACNIWLEPICGQDCKYCIGRPEKPLRKKPK